MKYITQHIRRQDRLLEEDNAVLLLRNGEFGVLSLLAEGNVPYGIPINFVWDGKSSIYIHCAPEGKKLQCLVICPQVSFCVVGKTKVISNEFTTGYESIVLQGKAYTGLSTEERMKALTLLLDKYSPENKVIGLKYAEKSFHRTKIIRIDIEEWSGKCKRVQSDT